MYYQTWNDRSFVEGLNSPIIDLLLVKIIHVPMVYLWQLQFQGYMTQILKLKNLMNIMKLVEKQSIKIKLKLEFIVNVNDP